MADEQKDDHVVNVIKNIKIFPHVNNKNIMKKIDNNCIIKKANIKRIENLLSFIKKREINN